MSVKLVLPALLTATAALFSTATAAAEPGDQASADQAVHEVYHDVQTKCTPSTPPSFKSITWNEFQPAARGNGTIHDAKPELGGAFTVSYYIMGVPPPAGSIKAGNWYVSLEFC